MVNEEKLRLVSRVGADRRRLLGKFYGGMSEEDRVEAHRAAGDLVRSQRPESPDEYFFYGVLIQALNKMYFDRNEALSRKKLWFYRCIGYCTVDSLCFHVANRIMLIKRNREVKWILFSECIVNFTPESNWKRHECKSDFSLELSVISCG